MYTISEEKLAAVIQLLPSHDRQDVLDTITADWPEGEEHQEWLDDAPPKEIADWVTAIL